MEESVIKTEEEITKKLGIKEANDDFFRNTKVKEFLDYCLEKNINIYFDTEIEAKIVLYLLENIDSYDRVAYILSNNHQREKAIFNYEEMAKWYKVYNPKKLEWFADGYEILLDDEYLKYAPVEWTEDVFYNLNSWLCYKDGKYFLKENPQEVYDFDYISPFYDNVDMLSQEKEKGRLEQAVKFLVSSTSEN